MENRGLAPIIPCVNFYAPELTLDLQALTEMTKRYGEVLAEAIRDVQRDTTQQQKLNGRLLVGSRQIGDKCEEMSKKAATVAKEHIEQLTAND